MVRGLLGLQKVFDTSLVDILTEELPEEAPVDLEERLTTILTDLSDSLAESLGPIVHKAALRGVRSKRKYRQKFERSLSKNWKKPLELLDLLILVATEAGHEFHRQFADEAQHANDFKFVALVSMHARACRIASAIGVLLRSGHADEAYSLWRALHEISVVSTYVAEQCQDTAKRYLLHETVQQYRLALKYRRHAARLGLEPIPQDEFDRLKEEYEALLGEFGKPFGDDYGWAALALGKDRPTIADIEEAACLEHWRPYYVMASANVHANAHGNFFNLGSSDLNRDILLAGPSYMGLVEPGDQTAISLCNITTRLLATEPCIDGIVISKLLGNLVERIGDEFVQAHEELQLLGSIQGEYTHDDGVLPPAPVLSRLAPEMQDSIHSLVRAYLKSAR